MRKFKRLSAFILSICICACGTMFSGCDMVLDILDSYLNEMEEEYIESVTNNGNNNDNSTNNSTNNSDNTTNNSDNTTNNSDTTESTTESTTDKTTSSESSEVVSGQLSDIDNATLSVHFLELGTKYTGDCTLIKCGDTEVLIDAGSKKASATTLTSYIDNYCTDGVLEYVIATHAHEDHIAGFVGNSTSSGYTGVLYNYQVGTIIEFAKSNSTSNIYASYQTARDTQVENGANCYTALECYNNENGASSVYYLNEQKSVYITILYQKYYETKASSENNYSVCTLLTQIDGESEYNYLFTGDLESDGESSLVDSNNLPHVNVLKGGHHGSSTSSTIKLLDAVTPDNIAICTCVGSSEYSSTNANQFPTQEMISRVCNYTENIYCTTLMVDYSSGDYTSLNGNIVFYYSESNLKLYCSNNDTKLRYTDWFIENRTWG